MPKSMWITLAAFIEQKTLRARTKGASKHMKQTKRRLREYLAVDEHVLQVTITQPDNVAHNRRRCNGARVRQPSIEPRVRIYKVLQEEVMEDGGKVGAHSLVQFDLPHLVLSRSRHHQERTAGQNITFGPCLNLLMMSLWVQSLKRDKGGPARQILLST
jgi:hypothetical protein